MSSPLVGRRRPPSPVCDPVKSPFPVGAFARSRTPAGPRDDRRGPPPSRSGPVRHRTGSMSFPPNRTRCSSPRTGRDRHPEGGRSRRGDFPRRWSIHDDAASPRSVVRPRRRSPRQGSGHGSSTGRSVLGVVPGRRDSRSGRAGTRDRPFFSTFSGTVSCSCAETADERSATAVLEAAAVSLTAVQTSVPRCSCQAHHQDPDVLRVPGTDANPVPGPSRPSGSRGSGPGTTSAGGGWQARYVTVGVRPAGRVRAVRTRPDIPGAFA